MQFGQALAIGALALVSAISFPIDADTLSGVEQANHLSTDPNLEQSLRGVMEGLGLDGPVAQKRLAVSLVDVTDMEHVRYAGVNDRQMMYAASLSKICALVAGFEQIQR